MRAPGFFDIVVFQKEAAQPVETWRPVVGGSNGVKKKASLDGAHSAKRGELNAGEQGEAKLNAQRSTLPRTARQRSLLVRLVGGGVSWRLPQGEAMFFAGGTLKA